MGLRFPENSNLPSACTALDRLLEPVVTARILIVAAHPDDETIGAGGLLARSTDAHVVVVTDGAPRERALWSSTVPVETREEYARIRREELLGALAIAGIPPERIHFLDVTDREASAHIPEIEGRLVEVINKIDPQIVLTHASEGAHVDHDATARAVLQAMRTARRGHPHEMAVYHRIESGIAVHEFAPGGPAARTLHLDDQLRTRKKSMLERYVSQRQYDAYFGTDVERYRCAEPQREVDTGFGGSSVPLVSVVVRTIGRDTLLPALTSIASQTYPNIETVLVHVDGDGHPPALKEHDGRVLRTVSAPGFDRPKAANAGLAAATGKYIAFLDDDDWYHSEHIASIVSALESARQARVAYAGVEVIEWTGEAPPLRRWQFDSAYDPVALLCENYIPLNALMFERELVSEGCRFDESFPLYEDWDFLIQLSRRTSFLKVPGISAVYRWPPGSGVNDPARVAAMQERVFVKWRDSFTPAEHVAVVRRAIEHTALNDQRHAQIETLQSRVQDQHTELEQLRHQRKERDDELGRLRPYVQMQSEQLEQQRDQLQLKNTALDELRNNLEVQEAAFDQLQTKLDVQDNELELLRPCVHAQEQQLEQLRRHLKSQDAELATLRPRVLAQVDDIARLTNDVASADQRLEAIQRTRSWRVTRPLRVTRRVLDASADRARARIVPLKVPLAAGRWPSRGMLRLVEAVEVLLTRGPAGVAASVRRRLGRRSITPPAEYSAPPQPGGAWQPIELPSMTPGSHAVSIVIPVLDNAAVTHRCLAALATHTPAGAYEVIVVDNGSGEETRAMLSGVDGLRVIRNEDNAGFVEACNQGAAVARGNYVLFLNNDTAVLPGWLDALVDMMTGRPEAGAVGARLLFPDGRLQEAGNIIWNDGLGWNYGKFEDPEAPEFGYVREVDYCSGACLLVRRALFEELRGFDLRYSPAYYEDVDLCFRIRERGGSVLYQPSARVVHVEGATAGTDDSIGFKHYQTINRQKFVERHKDALTAQFDPDPRLLRLARDRRRGKRILVIDHMVPHHDHDAGSVRMTALLAMLTELGHSVTFLPDNLARLEPYTNELQQLGVEVLYGPMSARKWLEANISEFELAILCRAYFAAKHLPEVLAGSPRPFVIFDTVDLHHLREERLAALQDDEGMRNAAGKTRELELDVIRRSDMVWVTSTHEADVLRQYGSPAAVEVVPTIHHVRTDIPGFANRRNLLFIGGFRHPPNEDAVLYFVEDVLPRIITELPQIQLLVAGSHMPQRIQQLASQHVVVLGYVKDLVPLFDSCRLSVAPLRYGAGLKGKITQSLAWGLPVVTSPTGAEGLRIVDREHAMIANDAAEMASRIVEIYQSDDLWQRLSENGRRYAQTHLGYDSVKDQMRTLLERLGPTHVGRQSRMIAQ